MKFCHSLDIELKCSGDEKVVELQFVNYLYKHNVIYEFICNNYRLRSVIDPKRHYKKGDSKSRTVPKYFQASTWLHTRNVGTVIESASDFFTGRLTKKERKATLADELLSDHTLGEYRKRKVREIEEQNRPGGVEKWKIKGRQSWKRAKQRRH
ncbi:hypothetical protein TEA_009735 [Camellia sinensis var. sinensis]|uniref:Fcf2 pre-rRNA processing C-terminal domain-containing protein n=1 Tax=Camellia sinensis var. sinensis TaxID=542762 RepID=A0A4S4DK12_CAMSN|nr:hypothetical protein TEA_009735 [Camellia sinensis var. sinensis]